MNPAQFMGYVRGLATESRFPDDRLLVGGDHLGPNPWKSEESSQAMSKSKALVRDCILAGYQKIHLDASMKCADDEADRPLDKVVSAQRTAELAQVAEGAVAGLEACRARPRYVIGTEVPVPGGAEDAKDYLRVSATADVQETIEITRHAFHARGLRDAWKRVIAVVVEAGVEFGHDTLLEYDSEKNRSLSSFIERYDQFVYEAHSTDYQTAAALRKMVEDHFAILKVGPALTFAFREAVFALAEMEEESLTGDSSIEKSGLCKRLDEAMLTEPRYWKKYYPGNPQEQHFARKYSFSDRSRYYWPVPEVQTALTRLMDNLETHPLPLSLLSQYLPEQYGRVRRGELTNTPDEIIRDKITSVLLDYSYACAGNELGDEETKSDDSERSSQHG
jgi:D-tagatose-1,6-bisphosphate aldolase subunit GatZ/KbaZ